MDDENDLTKYENVVQDAPQAQDTLDPMFRVVGDTKIPVSKHRGKLWKSRRDQGVTHQTKARKSWFEAIRYYQHDQTRDTNNSGTEDSADATSVSAQGGRNSKETENMVFANVSALVPMLYTKNPDAEFTAQTEETKPLSQALEKLMKKLASQKSAPGLNLKPKAKRAVVLASLCNLCWFEVGYTLKEQSSDRALQDLADLSKRFENAKDKKELKEVEAALIALESKIDMLSPSGPWVKLRKPWEVIIDPTAPDVDLSDAGWVMIEDMMPTELLRALYGRKNDEKNQWESVYHPTHILKSSNNDRDDNLTGDNFVLFSKEGSAKQMGFEDDNSYKAAQCTKVYYVWDKATRRCELYSDADWCYPIWVWDDPYQLDQFFPLVPLSFHTDPVRLYSKGEVTYYLDQQDTLNVMNNEFNRIRGYASSILAYNKNKLKDPTVLEDILSGTYNKRTIGLDLEEGDKLNDIMGPLLPPSAEAAKFFDKRGILESIDRISGVSSVQRGVEYKTNTTNRAIESYESQMQTRADEKMDAIEEAVGGVLWLVAQMCLQNMSAEEVQMLCGEGEAWQKVDPREISMRFTPRVVGGSTMKPTSRAKKEQAMQMAQALGQFARATPAAILVALKTLQQAFDNDLVINDKDWQMVIDGITSAIESQQAQAQAQAQSAQQQGQGAPQGAQGARGASNAPSSPDDNIPIDAVVQGVQQLAQFLDGMSTEIKTEIGVMLSRQVPVEQIAQRVVERLQQPQG
jgi:hypothetical protein